MPRNAYWGRRLIAAALVVFMGSALAGRAAAADAARTLPPDGRSLRAAVTAHLNHLSPAASAFAPQTTSTTGTVENRPFLRTPAGVAAVILMTVGAGYAIYSVSHDRKPVKSPIR